MLSESHGNVAVQGEPMKNNTCSVKLGGQVIDLRFGVGAFRAFEESRSKSIAKFDPLLFSDLIAAIQCGQVHKNDPKLAGQNYERKIIGWLDSLTPKQKPEDGDDETFESLATKISGAINGSFPGVAVSDAVAGKEPGESAERSGST